MSSNVTCCPHVVIFSQLCFQISFNSLKIILVRYSLGHFVKILSCSQSCLEFSLRIQEFIELIRQNKRMDAVRYVTLTLHYVFF